MCLLYVDFDDLNFVLVQIGLIGVFWDGGIINCLGFCYGLWQLWDMLIMIWVQNGVIGVWLFDRVNCVDFGDVGLNLVLVEDSFECMIVFYDCVLVVGIVLMMVGGDYLCLLLILCFIVKVYGLVGMIYFDSYMDLFKSYFGGM